MCSSAEQQQSLARYLTELLEVFFVYNTMLQPDKHTAGLFTAEQANHHLALTLLELFINQ